MRQCLVSALTRCIETGEVAEADPSIPFDRVRGDGAITSTDAPRQSVAAYAGEFEPGSAPAGDREVWAHPSRRRRSVQR